MTDRNIAGWGYFAGIAAMPLIGAVLISLAPRYGPNVLIWGGGGLLTVTLILFILGVRTHLRARRES